jgi:hypothetical protein
MMETKDYITGVVRKFDRKQAEESRTVEFVISDETRDRHGTVIPVNNWALEHYNANGIVGYQHSVYGGTDPNPDQVLGVGRAYIEDGQLIGSVTFEPKEINPLAEKIFQKVLHGTLKATSVGFREVTAGKWGEKDEAVDGSKPTYYFGQVELLEFSIVNIPSNPNAIRRDVEEEITNRMRDMKSECEALGCQLVNAQEQIEAKEKEIAWLRRVVDYYKQKSLRG